VLCFQECYATRLLSGNFRDRVVQGAKALGFKYSAMPPRTGRFPACLAVNSGLIIMSRIEIVKSHDEVFALSTESFNVNRGMLCAQLADGTFVVTAHVAPGPSASGKIAQKVIGGLIERQRAQQAKQLSAFIRRVVPPSAPLILAGDLNLSVRFESADGQGRQVPCLGIACIGGSWPFVHVWEAWPERQSVAGLGADPVGLDWVVCRW
jgi:endonuclease/exonuclease/phosphatase family metal-dependent hydrolase